MDLKQQRINVELGEKESEGIYSNLALISHSPSEFIVDFARVMPGVQKTRVYARIVMTPAHARMLFPHWRKTSRNSKVSSELLRSSEKRKRIKASDSKPKKGNEKLKSGQRIERMKRIDQRMKRIKRTCGELAEPYSSVLSVQSHLSQLTVDSLFFHLFNLLGIF